MYKKDIEHSRVNSFICTQDQSILLVEGINDIVGQSSELCNILNRRNIALDMIMQNAPKDEYACIGISASTNSLLEDKDALIKEIVSTVGQKANIYNGFIKYSISGYFLKGPNGLIDEALKQLGLQNIEVIMMSISVSRMEFLVKKGDSDKTIETIQKVIRKLKYHKSQYTMK